jgi:uncharacterized protein (TIGR02231 family)
MEISLEEGMLALDEVVVTGFQSRVAGIQISKNRKQKKTEAYKAPPSTVQQKQTTVEFTLDVPYTTPSNGEVYTIIIAEDEMEANYTYQTIPKLEEAAYLNAKIANWTQYNLLSGDINLYFENTYVGKSNLDTSSPSDTLDISLGRDRSVQIERTEIDNFRKRRSIANKQIDQRAYRLSIRNSKTEPINITLFDQVPISQNKDIEIEDIETSGGQLNEETGQVVWTLQLTPNEVVERTISYQVKYPKDRYVVVD